MPLWWLFSVVASSLFIPVFTRSIHSPEFLSFEMPAYSRLGICFSRGALAFGQLPQTVVRCWSIHLEVAPAGALGEGENRRNVMALCDITESADGQEHLEFEAKPRSR